MRSVLNSKACPLILKVRMLDGTLIFYRPDTTDEDILCPRYRRHRFFPPEYQVGSSDIILDVGAHIGIFTVLAARQAPLGKVFALEAEQENFTILERNIAANGLTNVFSQQLALSGGNGTVKLFRSSDNWGHSLYPPAAGVPSKGYDEVAAASLASFFVTHEIQRIDFMKMNVEGAEYDILLATPREVLCSIAAMVVEFHPVANHDLDGLVDRLHECGFAIRVVRSRIETGKGWIMASTE